MASVKNTYYIAKPNYGAGIGHQMANWIAGYWYAKQFGLNFAHVPFSTKKWEEFLGFGTGDIDYTELLCNGYKTVKLPLFKESNVKEVALQKKIIASYKTKNVVFIAEQDQFYKDQFGVIQEMQNKFYNAPLRKQDKLQFDNTTYNIAIHVRRGDIVEGQNKIENHTMRWMTNDYFINTLQNTLDYISTDKKVCIYLFSQGKKEDFIEFEQFSNLTYCLDMGAIESFLHMVYADVLITSKSSFSYKPALLNKGLKIVPKDFWHGYPKSNDWIMVDENGNLK
ncbi:hypothetical protein [Polaribacter sp. R77954]|uniref:hypothetical protein n=1 Tax=Polaribacter sp. R77954 TaxID=3093870 RepID=UPI0037C8D8FB